MKDNQEAIRQRNRVNLEVLLLAISCVMAVISIISWVTSEYYGLRFVATGSFAIGFCLLVFTRYGKKMPVLPMVYLNYAIMVAYCILGGLSISPSHVGTSILIVVLVLPVLFLDRTYRINIISLSSVAAYLLYLFLGKDSSVWLSEAMNLAAFEISGLIIGHFIRRTQLENIDMKRKLDAMAYSDFLTGLSNRRKLFKDMAETKYRNVAIIDIDYFKDYNDCFGHLAGDECLSSVADVFKETSSSDSLAFYRFGGDEFVCLSEDLDKEAFLAAMEKVRKAISCLDLRKQPHGGGYISCSIGLSGVGESHDVDGQQLISEADAAVYEAKKMGRNHLIVFSGDKKPLSSETTPS